MSRLDREPDVIRMASELKVDSTTPVSAIIGYCRQRMERICRDVDTPITSLSELQAVVCLHLRLIFEHVRTDEDLDKIIAKYRTMREFGFAALKADLDSETFATLLERHHVDASARDRYVAVIDCRGGEKFARQYFTRWHEIAHLLTITRQLELPFHRSTRDRDPIERLMDVIAGEIGFYDPLVKPVIKSEVAQAGRLTFAGVDRIRMAVCPDASFRSTLNACVSRVAHPIVLLETGMGYKTAELAQLRSTQLTLIPADPPKAQLRVLSAIPNEFARLNEIRVDKNMRVPGGSLIARHFHAATGLDLVIDLEERESLNIWRHSNGKPIGHVDVWVNSRRVGDRVLALLQPVPRKRPRRTTTDEASTQS